MVQSASAVQDTIDDETTDREAGGVLCAHFDSKLVCFGLARDATVERDHDDTDVID